MRSFLIIYYDDRVALSLSFTHTERGLMRIPTMVRYLQPIWRIIVLLILVSLIGLIRCGVFFVTAMSQLDSLPILLLFIRNSFFDRVTLQLMTSLINSLLFEISSTLLALSCLLAIVSHVGIRRLHMSFVTLITF
jgi:hypothetical protein